MLSLIEARRNVRPGDGLASELVTNHVLALIARGTLKGGARLPPERELANALSVSRTSVRTGLQALAAKGVLVVRHGTGSFVADGPPDARWRATAAAGSAPWMSCSRRCSRRVGRSK